ncbi:uncharacterized protein LOC127290354 [Leptopilina boulardi]|uniref:uncharacterized protein LOC127290354 n=1 Tax=Leptopilina boulardi TaxID=63433 RepID=UPI0021F65F92|nr:uncharacterized protein LOC127290354 [Leptopilina boulardi]
MSEKIKSKAFKRANNNIKERLKDFFLLSYSHYTAPGINLIRNKKNKSWNISSMIGMFQDYPYNCDLPKPLLPPVKLNREVLVEEDPALQLITTKAHMKNDMNRLKNYYLKYEKVMQKLKRDDIKWNKNSKLKTTTLPRYIAEIAEIIELDPDPYFSGTYNWYYTGGTLNNICHGNENILLFPYCEELIATSMSLYEASVWKPNLLTADKCQLDGKLYELRNTFTNDSYRIIGRFKNHCILYNLYVSNSKLNLIELHKEISSIPFVSADLNPFKVKEFSTVNVERLISIWDVTKRKPISSGNVINRKISDDNWGSIRYQNMDPNVLIFTDRCCVHYIDTREPIERPALSMCPKSNLEVCENLCYDNSSRNSFCRYVGTYHSLLLCDNRVPDECVQQKWTHQFKGAPLLFNVINKGDQDVIILTSQLQRERSIILNNWTNENDSQSYSLPFTPPSILETLQESQMQGKCLDPLMKHRLGLSNAGCTLIPDTEGQIYLFLQNSIGDIFYQNIMHEENLVKYSAENLQALRALESWENAIQKQRDTVIPLVFSEKTSMNHIFENLKRSKLKYTHPEKTEIYIEPRWKESLEEMNSYVDLLAPELLAVWEVNDNAVLPSTSAPRDKVLNWLETTQVADGFTQSTMPSQDIEVLSMPFQSQELVSVSQQVEMDIFEQMFLPKIKTKTKSKEVKKRKYIPGF